jgi:choline-sulfatase
VASRPNILFICTDQQRYDSLGCYGNPHIQTPHIDALAESGVLFEQCYVQSPVCAPSRASFVTGQYPSVHGLWANGVSLPDGAAIFSRALADSGYHCGMIGKMHLSSCFEGRTEPRQDDGYRYYKWAHDPTHGSPENDYHLWLKERHPDLYAEAAAGRPRVRHQAAKFDTMPTEAHYSRWASERAIEFLNDDARDADQPFFLWLNFFDPHHPFEAPQEYLDCYDPATLPDPIGVAGEMDSKPEIQRQASVESYAGFARGFTDHSSDEIRDIIHAYYAMVSLIDDEVQRVLDRLDALGLAEDTLVVFTSDHGEMLGDHQLLLKGPMLYDGAVRVPLIMRWPGTLPEGERTNDLVQWIDLNATIMEAAGLEPLPRSQGTSLLSLARGDANALSRDWAICEYLNSGHAYDPPVLLTMLRHDRYKLVVQHGEPATDRERDGELYDLEADPQELTNLWDVEDMSQVRIRLERMLLDVMVATRDRSQPREAHW